MTTPSVFEINFITLSALKKHLHLKKEDRYSVNRIFA